MLSDFTETVISDHDFAAWLRDKDAVNNYSHIGRFTMWRRQEDGKVVALAKYDNTASGRRTWLRNGI